MTRPTHSNLSSAAREEARMGTTTVPAWADRCMTHLAEANRIRLGRAALLRRMWDRSPSESASFAAELVEDPPDVLCTMTALALVEKVRRVGPQAAERLLRAAGVPPAARLDGLTARQRAALAGALRFRAALSEKTGRAE